nr:response regulator transcription factor [Streptomyces boncukensis]
MIVDDDALVRAGLAMILRGVPDVRVVAEVADGAEVPAAVAQHRPDVVLMDIRMVKVDGVTATRQLRSRPDAPEVLILTTFDLDEHVVDALQAGASGFLVKDTAPEEIVRAVRQVASGEPTLSPRVTRQLIAQITGPAARARPARASGLPADLAEREREVARLVGEGMSNTQIGEELFLSVATVKAYVSRLLARLGLDNRVQLALLANGVDLSGGTERPPRHN